MTLIIFEELRNPLTTEKYKRIRQFHRVGALVLFQGTPWNPNSETSNMHLNVEKKASRLLSCAIPVSNELYANNSDYFSRLKPKIHSNYQTANDACIQCQIDILGKEYLGKFPGTLNPVSGGVSALALPYTLPENFALVSYIIEAGTLGDGMSF